MAHAKTCKHTIAICETPIHKNAAIIIDLELGRQIMSGEVMGRLVKSGKEFEIIGPEKKEPEYPESEA